METIRRTGAKAIKPPRIERWMTSRIIAAGILAANLLVVSQAYATTVQSTFTDSGTSSPANLSFDGTNVATTTSGAGTSNPGGAFTFSGISQFNFPTTSVPCTFIGPGGTTENGIQAAEVDGYTISRDTSGDLLFAHDNAPQNTLCLNPSTQDFVSVPGAATITGGTGKYTGATGSSKTRCTGHNLTAPPPPGYGYFNYTQCKGSSSVTTP